MGSIEQIFIAAGKREPVEAVESAQLEAGKGIVGDRYHVLAEQHIAKDIPVPANHISFVEQDRLEEFIDRHNLDVKLGDFRRSVITKGIDLNALVGKQFRVGDAICYGEELCEPCSYLASIVHPAVLPEMEVTAGLRATVIESGVIACGSNIEEL